MPMPGVCMDVIHASNPYIDNGAPMRVLNYDLVVVCLKSMARFQKTVKMEFNGRGFKKRYKHNVHKNCIATS